MGKHKPIWDPSTDCGDYVVAVGLHDLHTTGKKRYQKKYYSHTTRPGSLKEITMDRMMEKWGGSEVLRRAVRGMLPKNRLRDDRMARLKSELLLQKHTNVTISNRYSCSVRGRRSPLQAKHYQGLHPSFDSTAARGQGCLCSAEAAIIASQPLYRLASTFLHGVQGKIFHLGC
jgi:ribosomal protein L13